MFEKTIKRVTGLLAAGVIVAGTFGSADLALADGVGDNNTFHLFLDGNISYSQHAKKNNKSAMYISCDYVSKEFQRPFTAFAVGTNSSSQRGEDCSGGYNIYLGEGESRFMRNFIKEKGFKYARIAAYRNTTEPNINVGGIWWADSDTFLE